jgi:hypothetical protein
MLDPNNPESSPAIFFPEKSIHGRIFYTHTLKGEIGREK